MVGSVNTDLTFTVDALPRPGETVLASALASCPGGKGANQAVAAARAGARVQFVGAVGSDTAASPLLAHLRANDVGTDGVVRVPGPSGTAAIMVDANAENLIAVAPGANAHLVLGSAATRDVIADADVVLCQLEIPVTTAVAAARLARESDAIVIVNASPPSTSPSMSALAELTDVVVVNESEADEWRWPVAHLVITRGAKGASHLADGRWAVIAAPPVEPVDTTGAGDVFAGVLAAGWSTDRPRALRRACAAGALATLVAGAGDCAPFDEAIDDVLDG
ncbi:MAG: ribokinase [Mycobacteriaceae bacterium]|nr:ribokinase [Mycobacteriaceae bacterium]